MEKVEMNCVVCTRPVYVEKGWTDKPVCSQECHDDLIMQESYK